MALIGTISSDNRYVTWFCGGTLISKNFVLTAAHCTEQDLTDLPLNLIRLGKLNTANTKDDAKETDFKITSIIVHPNYTIQYETSINDIALLKFEGLSSFDNYIRPICLNTAFDIPDQKYVAVGWGTTESGSPSDDLRSVELSPQPNCESLFRSFNSKEMICAGYAPGGKNSCPGDSGGPLQIENEKSECPTTPIYTQIGIISFGGMVCAEKNIPSASVRVSHFIPWIESIVWK